MFDTFKKNKFTRTELITNPRIHYIRDLELPKHSLLVIPTISDTLDIVDAHHPLVSDDYTSFYLTEHIEPMGNLRSININTEFRKAIRGKDKLKVTKDNRLVLNKSKQLLIDTGALNANYLYTKHDSMYYFKWNNVTTTYLDFIDNDYSKRNIFLTLNLPTEPIPKSELIKLVELEPRQLVREVKDNFTYNLIMLLQALDGKGLLLELPINTLQKINIMLVVGVKVVMFNLLELLNISKVNNSNGKYNYNQSLHKVINLWGIMLAQGNTEDVEELLADKVVIEVKDEKSENINLLTESGYLDNKDAQRLVKTEVVTLPDITLPDLKDFGQATAPKKYVPYDSYNGDRLTAIDSAYETIHDDVIKSNFYALTNVGFNILSYNVLTDESIDGKVFTYVVEIVTPKGKKSTVKVKLSELKDGYLIQSGKEYRMRRQRVDLPIRKIKQKGATFSSYYGSIMFNKGRISSRDVSIWLLKELKSNSNVTMLLPNEHSFPGVELPRYYQLLSRQIRSFRYDGITFQFDYNSRYGSKLKEAEKHGVCIGTVKNTYYLLSGNNLLVWNNGKVVDKGDLFSYLEIPYSHRPLESPYINIFGKEMPAILPILYYDGLDKFLKDNDVSFNKVVTSNRIEVDPDSFPIIFKDYTYHIPRSDKLGNTMLYGLHTLKAITKSLDTSVVNSKAGMVKFISELGFNEGHILEFTLWKGLFIDPFTKAILKHLSLPTTFIPAYLKTCELLLSDDYPEPNDVTHMRVRGNDRIAGLFYKEIIKAARLAMKNRAPMTMPLFAMFTKLNSDSAMVLADDLNVISTLQQIEDITYLGEGGLNIETMTDANKAYHPSDVGIASEANRDSGNVGSATYSSTSPILDKFGIRTDEKVDVGNILGTSSQLRAFSLHDDAKRMNFISIQDKHTIPTSEDIVLPIRTGYEVVVGNKVPNKFCINATKPGLVLSVSSSNIKIKYEDGTETYKLIDWTSKEESGTTLRHVMTTRLTKGMTIDSGDNIIYDELYFGPDIFNPKGVAMKLGSLAMSGFMEDDGAYEDSAIGFSGFTKRTTIKKEVVLSFTHDAKTMILNPTPVGTVVKEEEILYTIGGVGSDYVDKDIFTLLNDLTETTHQSTTKGTVMDIEVKYKCNISDMSASIARLATESDKRLMFKTGYTGKVSDGYSINGKTLMDNEVEIKYYIQTDDTFNNGDKGVIANQLKYTLSPTPDYDMYTEDGTPIDVLFSGRSVAARIVHSPKMLGTMNLLLKRYTDDVVAIYFGKD